MKKLGGVLTIALVVVVAMASFWLSGFAMSPRPVETSTEFINRHSWFTTQGQVRGIYIHRPPNADSFHFNDIFYGHVRVDTVSLPFHDFEFAAVRMVNGEWIETDWLEIIVHANRLDVWWELRKVLPAGRYGVRAMPMENVFVNGQWVRQQVQAWDEESFSMEGLQVVYEILYADELRYIVGTDGTGNSLLNVHGERDRVVEIIVGTNDGAMDKYALVPEVVRNGVAMGNLYVAAEVDMLFMDISITRNGLEVASEAIGPLETPQDGVIGILQTTAGIELTLPDNLPYGQFVVRFTHEASETIFGTFIIDNTRGGRVGGGGGLGAIHIVFFVLGFLFAATALFLYVAPKLAYARETSRYKKQEVERYLATDGADDHHYKAQTQKDSLKNSRERMKKSKEDNKEDDLEEGTPSDHKTKSRGFLEAMRENRAKREMARDAGLTMEEFRELENQQKKVEKAKTTSLATFRKAVDEHTGNIVEVQKPKETKQIVDGVEFDTLKGVEAPSILNRINNATQTTQSTPTPPPAKPAPASTPPAPKPQPSSGESILSKMRKLDDSNK